MITLSVSAAFDAMGLRKKVQKANITSLSRAGAYVRGVAMKSIYVRFAKSKADGKWGKKKNKRAAGASDPGKPPHSKFGAIKNAIVFQVDGLSSIVIGPAFSRLGDVARVHEFGGTRNRPDVYKVRTGSGSQRRREIRRKKPVYPARPFMGPALERTRDRIPSCWAGSVRG